MQNLIDDPAYRAVLIQLRGRLLHWYMETCDVVPWDYDQRCAAWPRRCAVSQ